MPKILLTLNLTNGSEVIETKNLMSSRQLIIEEKPKICPNEKSFRDCKLMQISKQLNIEGRNN